MPRVSPRPSARTAVRAAVLAAALLPCAALAEEADRLSLTQQAPATAVTEGAKVVISFNIMIPDANTTIKDNLAQFVQGKHELLPALERAIDGMKPGEQKRIELPADQAFGPYDDAKRTTMQRTELPNDVRPGTVLTARDGRPFTVVDLNDQRAVVDYNHPLAGKRLVFDVKVLKVERPG
jgi:FKBP-type peptidyl-prolyl cis-trans isomerase 2